MTFFSCFDEIQQNTFFGQDFFFEGGAIFLVFDEIEIEKNNFLN